MAANASNHLQKISSCLGKGQGFSCQSPSRTLKLSNEYRFIQGVIVQKGVGTANTSVILHNGRLQALQETDSPYEVICYHMLTSICLAASRLSPSGTPTTMKPVHSKINRGRSRLRMPIYSPGLLQPFPHLTGVKRCLPFAVGLGHATGHSSRFK